MFHITSITSAAVQIMGLVALPETYKPTILHKRASELRLSRGHVRTDLERNQEKVAVVLMKALIRPCRLLGSQPIVQFLAVFVAYVYGLMYLALSTYSAVWVDIYGERPDIAGLNYVSLAIGFLLGTQICAPINDYVSPSVSSLYFLSLKLPFIELALAVQEAESSK